VWHRVYRVGHPMVTQANSIDINQKHNVIDDRAVWKSRLHWMMLRCASVTFVRLFVNYIYKDGWGGCFNYIWRRDWQMIRERWIYTPPTERAREKVSQNIWNENAHSHFVLLLRIIRARFVESSPKRSPDCSCATLRVPSFCSRNCMHAPLYIDVRRRTCHRNGMWSRWDRHVSCMYDSDWAFWWH